MVDEGAGDLTLEPLEFLDTMAHWLAGGRRLYQERAVNARRLGRPDAAFVAANLIWQLAENGANERRKRLPVSREKLKDLLRQFSGIEKPLAT